MPRVVLVMMQLMVDVTVVVQVLVKVKGSSRFMAHVINRAMDAL
jgi:hypothetical protein